MKRKNVVVESVLLKTRESNKSWPLSFLLGVTEERLLELELWDEVGDSSSSSSMASNLRLRDGVSMGEVKRCFDGVEGSEGGGLGRVCSGMILYRPSLERKSCYL